jgi:tRNA (guanine-N7-)-methyltransferase
VNEPSSQQTLEKKGAAFFGRRKGKTLRAHQAGLMDTLLPQVRVDLSAPVSRPGALFPGCPDDLRLEVGFGGGEHLAADALAHPERGFLGCEPFVNGVAKLMARIETSGLRNIRVHPGDAGDLIDALPAASLSGVCILYPDPWPKRRHKERRFISDRMLSRLARVMRSGAELRFASDIDDYVHWTLARILRSPDFLWPAQNEAKWSTPWPNWSGTRYEDKAMREGRRPVYLTFLRR